MLFHNEFGWRRYFRTQSEVIVGVPEPELQEREAHAACGPARGPELFSELLWDVILGDDAAESSINHKALCQRKNGGFGDLHVEDSIDFLLLH